LQSVSAIMLQPGTNYYLSFDLIGSQRGLTTSATVDFGPYEQTFVLASNDDSSGIVINQLVTVSTATMAFLTFTSNTPGDIGSVLDDVTITDQSSTTPEPGTLALVSSGVVALLGARKRWLGGN
jgi:PEP-CTERM motif